MYKEEKLLVLVSPLSFSFESGVDDNIISVMIDMSIIRHDIPGSYISFPKGENPVIILMGMG